MGNTLECMTPFECSNRIDTTAVFDLFCQGYSSCSNSSFGVINNDVFCDGSFSCIYMGPNDPGAFSGLFGSVEHYSRGFASSIGLNMDFNDLFQDKICGGELSCALTNVFVLDNIFCYGSKSCIHSELNIINGGTSPQISVQAYSPFALYNSTINSNTQTMELLMYGLYAGFQSTFNCIGDDNGNGNCLIDCKGTGCVGMNINCHNSTICTVNCNDTALNYCPNVIKNDILSIEPTVIDISDETLCINDLTKIDGESYDFYQLLPLDKDEYQVLFDINTINNQRDNQTCQKTCDANQECISEIFFITEKSACCTGLSGCAETIVSLEANGESIICDGYFGCTNSDIDILSSSGIIFSRGEDGLFESVVKYIGEGSLQDINTKVLCTGEDGCEEANVTNITTVICDTYDSCFNTQFINVENIYAMSYRSIDGAIISFDSQTSINDNNELNIFIMSYESVNSLSIICDIDTICTIYCQDLGCNQNQFTIGEECQCNIVEETETFVESTGCSSNEFTVSPTEEPTEEPTMEPELR